MAPPRVVASKNQRVVNWLAAQWRLHMKDLRQKRSDKAVAFPEDVTPVCTEDVLKLSTMTAPTGEAANNANFIAHELSETAFPIDVTFNEDANDESLNASNHELIRLLPMMQLKRYRFVRAPMVTAPDEIMNEAANDGDTNLLCVTSMTDATVKKIESENEKLDIAVKQHWELLTMVIHNNVKLEKVLVNMDNNYNTLCAKVENLSEEMAAANSNFDEVAADLSSLDASVFVMGDMLGRNGVISAKEWQRRVRERLDAEDDFG